MAVVHGWDCSINFDASVNKELLGIGDAVTTDFSSNLFPIVDGTTRIWTSDPTKVLIWFGETLANNDGTVYTLDGSAGLVSFVVAPDDGSNIIMTYNYTQIVGYCQVVDFGMDCDIEGAYGLGSRTARELNSGQKRWSGTYEQLYIDHTLLGKCLAPDPSNAESSLNELNLDLTIAIAGATDITNTGTWFKLEDVIFNTYHINITENAFVSEGGTFSYTWPFTISTVTK